MSQLCFGRNLGKTLGLAVEIEGLARQYMITLAVAEPAVLDDAEMDIILAKFQTYGKQQKELDTMMSGSEFLFQHAVVPPPRHGPVVKGEGATSSGGGAEGGGKPTIEHWKRLDAAAWGIRPPASSSSGR